MDSRDGDEFDEAPICPYCGVTCLPSESFGDATFVCENPDCEAFEGRLDS